jgi:rare lipoprotein A (peptidoglycan hydrolase)
VLRLGLCVALLLVPLLLLSSPRHALSRSTSIAERARGALLAAIRRATHVSTHSTAVTPWTTTVVLADDIAHSVAAATTTTTLAQVPVVAVRYDPTASTSPTTLPAPRPTTPTTLAPRPATTTAPPPPKNQETGEASWYQAPAGTCASPDLAFGTEVTVTDLGNGLSTTCRVEDRGPAVAGRIIDLSEETFSQIASTSQGVIEVRISW